MDAFVNGLKAIAESLSGSPRFFHEKEAVMNRETGSASAEEYIVFAPALGSGTVTKAGSGFRVMQTVMIEFVKRCEFGASISEASDPSKQQVNINLMFDKAIEFMQILNNSVVFEHPTRFDMVYVYDTFDDNYSGILVTFDLTLKQPLSLCAPTT